MWKWHKVRRANIPDDLREQFELYGETVLVMALGVTRLAGAGESPIQTLAWNNRAAVAEWL
jgi:hypothetical protein